jgi:hypothetical protein
LPFLHHVTVEHDGSKAILPNEPFDLAIAANKTVVSLGLIGFLFRGFGDFTLLVKRLSSLA